jgi:LCP family protein required for cell wall assembly
MADDTMQTPGTPGGLTATTVDDPTTEPSLPETSPETPPPTKPGRRRKQKGFIRRHKILIALAVILALVAGAAGGYYWWINHQLSAIPRVDAGIAVDPAKEGNGQNNQDLDILLLGADNGGDKETVADDLKDGKWTPFAHRSDTIMIAHIPADRGSVQIISIPRDTWVPIDGYPYADGHAKINGAFAYGGPSLAVKTVQQLTGMHIDHVAIIDWAGFKDLTTALGGVRVYIPETFYDDSQRITWEQGWHTLEGEEALQYVRTRHGLANGDFDRIARQQNFMRATMQKLISSMHGVGAISTINHLLGTLKNYLTIDQTWENDELKNLALSLRNIHADNVQFFTAPLGSYATSSDGQSIVRLDKKKSGQLFRMVDNDNVQRYTELYPRAELHGDQHID